jgi:peptidyl-tRNA hydrolase, PTH1 family
MFYVVGLGNPGVKYAYTRHNLGWLVCDALQSAWALSTPTASRRYYGRISEGVVEGNQVVLLYPDTFMNESGKAVRALVPKDATGRLIVVYDDVALPQGTFRISFGNGAGGHNGVISVIEALGTKDFTRIRIGIAPVDEQGKAIRPAGEDLSSYVLTTMAPHEQKIFEALLPEVITAITKIVLSAD